MQKFKVYNEEDDSFLILDVTELRSVLDFDSSEITKVFKYKVSHIRGMSIIRL